MPSDPGGIYAAAITARRAGEHSIDLGSMLDSIDFLAAGGLDGIALLGSTGEFIHFEIQDRARLATFAAKRSPVPVMVNVSHSTFDGAVALAREAASAGVAGVLLMPPHYFRYDAESIRDFFLQFAAAVDGQVPVYLYNIPLFTSEIPVSVAAFLLGTGLFAGIKDSSGSFEYFAALRGTAASYVFFSGSERLYARVRDSATQAGVYGIISGVASAVPELVVALARAVESGDAARVAMLDARVGEFLDWFWKFPVPMAVKEAAALRGVKAGVSAVPLPANASRRLDEFREWFRAWLPTVLAECGVRESGS